MGNIFKTNHKEKKVYKNIIESNNMKIKEIYKNIKSIKNKIDVIDIENSSYKANLISEELQLYKQLFKYNNTKESDILEFLLLKFELFKINLINKDEMEKLLRSYNHFISDGNYDKNFPELRKRDNALAKINKLINILIKTDINVSNPDEKIKRTKKFMHTIIDIRNSELIVKIKVTNAVTWENKELYIYNLYLMFLFSLEQKINYHKKHPNPVVINSKEYHKLYEDYLIALNDKEKEDILNKMQLMNICESNFIKVYMKNFNQFLIKVNDNFKNKFQNNELTSETDRSIFEDYFYFLSYYKFDSTNSLDIRIFRLWNETFCTITNENKIELIKKYNNFAEKDVSFFCELKNEVLTITTDDKQENIENLDDYCFSSLLGDIYQNRLDNLDYYKNKNLKPHCYKKNLFIMKKKDIWKKLNLKILGSNAIKEVVDTFFNNSYIDILGDEELLSEALDNIKFYIYKTSSSASSNEDSLNIYEFGLYNIEKTMSESLLIFYAFNSVSNIHEIGGHLNIRIQNFNSLDKRVESPKIVENEKLYTEYARERKKESGETIEISLFGKWIGEITLKEALYILEPNNYNSLQEFKNNFKKCNTKKIKEIISEETNELYLKPLGINIEELEDDSNKMYKNNSTNISRTEQKITYSRGVSSSHPPEFYYEIDKKFVKYVLENYKD